jgi:hypothetical protein
MQNKQKNVKYLKRQEAGWTSFWNRMAVVLEDDQIESSEVGTIGTIASSAVAPTGRYIFSLPPLYRLWTEDIIRALLFCIRRIPSTFYPPLLTMLTLNEQI